MWLDLVNVAETGEWSGRAFGRGAVARGEECIPKYIRADRDHA